MACIERRFTGDRVAHHLLDRPGDAPAHTATGLAGLVLFFIPFLAGSGDILAETITRILRCALLIAPLLTWLVAFWVPLAARDPGTPGHPHGRRAPAAHVQRGYETIWPDPGSSARHVCEPPWGSEQPLG